MNKKIMLPVLVLSVAVLAGCIGGGATDLGEHPIKTLDQKIAAYANGPLHMKGKIASEGKSYDFEMWYQSPETMKFSGTVEGKTGAMILKDNKLYIMQGGKCMYMEGPAESQTETMTDIKEQTTVKSLEDLNATFEGYEDCTLNGANQRCAKVKVKKDGQEGTYWFTVADGYLVKTQTSTSSVEFSEFNTDVPDSVFNPPSDCKSIAEYVPYGGF